VTYVHTLNWIWTPVCSVVVAPDFHNGLPHISCQLWTHKCRWLKILHARTLWVVD